MICQLCLEEKELLKKSHIIPQFMYKGIFDEQHFMYKLDLSKKNKLSKQPTGIYDKNILCSDCDRRIIGSLETYASMLIFGGRISDKSKPVFDFSTEGLIETTNIDYTCFKLFLLSLLWRGGISNNDIFRNIELGPHKETIRNMLLNNNPGKELEYETCIVFYKNDEIPIKSLTPARKIKTENNTCYLIHINQMSIYFNISKTNKLEFFRKAGIRKDNTMTSYYLVGDIAKKLFQKSTGIFIELRKN
jgi:hypothetical protein